MTSDELTAMATLDFDKINDGWLNTMPNDLLGAELADLPRLSVSLHHSLVH